MCWRRELQMNVAAIHKHVRAVPLVGVVDERDPRRLFLVYEHMARGTVLAAVREFTASDAPTLPQPWCDDVDAKRGTLPLEFRRYLAEQCLARISELERSCLRHRPVTTAQFVVDHQWRVFLRVSDVLVSSAYGRIGARDVMLLLYGFFRNQRHQAGSSG